MIRTRRLLFGESLSWLGVFYVFIDYHTLNSDLGGEGGGLEISLYFDTWQRSSGGKRESRKVAC